MHRTHHYARLRPDRTVVKEEKSKTVSSIGQRARATKTKQKQKDLKPSSQDHWPLLPRGTPHAHTLPYRASPARDVETRLSPEAR